MAVYHMHPASKILLARICKGPQGPQWQLDFTIVKTDNLGGHIPGRT